MIHLTNVFSKAITLVEFEKSGNPNEKYRSGRGLLSSFIREATATGNYVPYIDQIVSETTTRLPELAQEITIYSKATCRLSIEHLDPHGYIKIKLLESYEEFISSINNNRRLNMIC